MKKIVSLALILLACGAFAAAEPQVCCINFSTPGPDKYADGTEVALGECYALVWSVDGVFEGVKADGTPIDANDRVVYVAATEAAGKCTGKDVQIADNVMFGSVKALDGQFGVYLLDTRKYAASGDGSYTVGKVNPVNYAQKAVAEFKATLSIDNAVAPESGVAVLADAASPLPAGEPTTPTITGLEIGDETVTLTVDNTSAYANYAVSAGETPAASGVTGAPKNGNGTIALIVAKPVGNAGFFKVIRK